jgi:hypothetical protein
MHGLNLIASSTLLFSSDPNFIINANYKPPVNDIKHVKTHAYIGGS